MPSTILAETVSQSGYSNGRSATYVYTRTNASAPEERFRTLATLTTTLVALLIPTGTQDVFLSGPSGNAINILIAGDAAATVGTETIPLHPTEESAFAVIASTLLFIASESGTIAGVVARFE